MTTQTMPTNARTRRTLAYVAAGALAAAGLMAWGTPAADAAPLGCPDVAVVSTCSSAPATYSIAQFV